jgi:small subunit ribosomal protein S20
MKQNEKRRIRNKSIRSNTKTIIKKVLNAIEEQNVESAEQLFREATKTIYKAKSKGVYHKRNAARKVSRLAVKLNALKAGTEQSATA